MCCRALQKVLESRTGQWSIIVEWSRLTLGGSCSVSRCTGLCSQMQKMQTDTMMPPAHGKQSTSACTVEWLCALGALANFIPDRLGEVMCQ